MSITLLVSYIIYGMINGILNLEDTYLFIVIILSLLVSQIIYLELDICSFKNRKMLDQKMHD